MATAYKAELYDIQSVLDFYAEADGVAFSVYAGTYTKPEFIRWAFDGNEKTNGLQVLEQALSALKQNTENTNTYTLQVFRTIQEPATGSRKKKSDDIKILLPVQISFRLNSPERYTPYGQMSGVHSTDPALTAILQKVVDGQNALISKLNADQFEDEIEEKPKGLAGLLENPKMQEMAIMAISGLIGKFINGDNAPQALSGIKEDQNAQEVKALEAVQILKMKDPLYGDHLQYLANLNDAQYQTLLSIIS